MQGTTPHEELDSQNASSELRWVLRPISEKDADLGLRDVGAARRPVHASAFEGHLLVEQHLTVPGARGHGHVDAAAVVVDVDGGELATARECRM